MARLLADDSNDPDYYLNLMLMGDGEGDESTLGGAASNPSTPKKPVASAKAGAVRKSPVAVSKGPAKTVTAPKKPTKPKTPKPPATLKKAPAKVKKSSARAKATATKKTASAPATQKQKSEHDTILVRMLQGGGVAAAPSRPVKAKAKAKTPEPAAPATEPADASEATNATMAALATAKRKLRNISSSDYVIERNIDGMCTEYEGESKLTSKKLTFANLYPARTAGTDPVIMVHLAYSKERGWFVPPREALSRIYNNPRTGARRRHTVPEGNRIQERDSRTGELVPACYWDDYYYARVCMRATGAGGVSASKSDKTDKSDKSDENDKGDKSSKNGKSKKGGRITVQRDKVAPQRYGDQFSTYEGTVTFSTLAGIHVPQGGSAGANDDDSEGAGDDGDDRAKEKIVGAVLMQPPASVSKKQRARARSTARPATAGAGPLTKQPTHAPPLVGWNAPGGDHVHTSNPLVSDLPLESLAGVLAVSQQDTEERLTEVTRHRNANHQSLKRGRYDQMRALGAPLPPEHTEPLSYWLEDFAACHFVDAHPKSRVGREGRNVHGKTLGLTLPEDIAELVSVDSLMSEPVTREDAIAHIRANPHVVFALKMEYMLHFRDHVYWRLRAKLQRMHGADAADSAVESAAAPAPAPAQKSSGKKRKRAASAPAPASTPGADASAAPPAKKAKVTPSASAKDAAGAEGTTA